MAQTGRKRGERKKPVASPEKDSLTFDYMKSNFFRVVRVNGVVGGLTPNGEIHMGVWNQRVPYPRQVVHTIIEGEKLGPEIARTTRETDVIREVEAGLVFDANLARAMIAWLEKRLTEIAEFSSTRKAEED